MIRILRGAAAGATAGAAGITALNAAAYADMTVRGRPASQAPQTLVERLAGKLHIEVPGNGDMRSSRFSGAGALAGMATGIAVGAVYGALRECGLQIPVSAGAALTGLAAMAAADAPLAALHVSDPRTWSATDWVSDVVPHACYGVVTAACTAALTDCGPRARSSSRLLVWQT